MDTEAIKNIVITLLERMGFGAEIEEVAAYQGVTPRVCVRVRGDACLLIGERGANLAALEHIARKTIHKQQGMDARITLDINDYRLRRLEDLKQDVKTAAKQVRLYAAPVPLRPMTSFERRIVHLLLDEYPDITTESSGEEPERRVIIKPLAR
jgi:spoIIIJ-associated protein